MCVIACRRLFRTFQITVAIFNLFSSFCSESAENIQAYVKEVTKELATEIKSEIREVISKVEDVLESTDSLDMSGATFSSLGNVR